MINSYVTLAASELILDEKDCFVSIRKDNLKSIHACKNAGFTEVRSVIEDGYLVWYCRKKYSEKYETHFRQCCSSFEGRFI